METFVPSTSPLFSYSPCKDCLEGFSLPNSADTTNNTLTTHEAATIALNFTGSSISFALSPTTWTANLTINGTAFPFNLSSPLVRDLPVSRHEMVLSLAPGINDAESTALSFSGATLGLGVLTAATTNNVTIDDTAWREDKVLLTPGWNMLETGESNWINQTQLDEEMRSAGMSWNSSISWTEQAGAATTIRFNGSAIWAYGFTGGEAGSYEVRLDNTSIGIYDASGGPRSYGSLLYHTSGLSDAEHNLTLTNLVQGQRLSFDRLVCLSGLLSSPITTSIPPPVDPLISPTSSSGGSAGLSKGAIAGIAVSVSLVVLGLLIWAILACTKVGRKAKQKVISAPMPRALPAKASRSYWRWSSSTGGTGLAQPAQVEKHPWSPLEGQANPKWPKLGSSTYAYDTHAPTPPPFTVPLPSANLPRAEASPKSAGTSFLRISKSPRPSKTWKSEHTTPPITTDFSAGPEGNVMSAILSDAQSPLSSLRNSYLPRVRRLSEHFGRGRRSVDAQTTLGDIDEDAHERPITPGGILDGYMGSPTGHRSRADPEDRDVSQVPSLSGTPKRRFFGKVLGEGRPGSGASGMTENSVGSGWRYM